MNVRQRPSAGASVLKSLPNAAFVWIVVDSETEADGYEWIRVSFDDGSEGWVAKKFLTDERPQRR
ncbi:MAG: SH3 domain-containing protein [Proteobacteria bacterium]|nr:SH3 domain-containing protein [Pseudomonadota bacterium]